MLTKKIVRKNNFYPMPQKSPQNKKQNRVTNINYSHQQTYKDTLCGVSLTQHLCVHSM